MKTIKELGCFLCLIAFFTTSLVAQPDLYLEEGRINDLLTVRLIDLDRQYTTISVYDLHGKTWLRKQLWKRDEYSAGFDLGPLPDGDYLLATHSQGARIVRPFTKKGMDIVLLQPKPARKEQRLARRVVNGNTNRAGQLITRIDQPAGGTAIDLQLANLHMQTTQVGLLSTAGIPAVFEDRVSGRQGYAQRINLENLATGEYILYVQTAGVSIMQFLDVTEAGVELRHALSREPRTGDSVLIATR